MLAKSTKVSLGSKKQKLTLVGRSRAGEATAFALPELKWFFDCGALVQGWKPKVVFLTHTHSDHAHYLTHVKDEKHPPIIYLPTEASQFVKAHLIAYQEMTECKTHREIQESGSYVEGIKLKPVEAGDRISFKQGGSTFIVRTLQMHHRVPCVGYSIFQKRETLKDEFGSLPGKEIGRLKKEGVCISDSVEEPLVCFMGDTTVQAFHNHPEILEQHERIVIECSFIMDEDIERAATTTHMHWNDLRPIVEANPSTMFFLTHFSLKYSSLAIRQFFCQVQLEMGNVHPMLDEEEVIQAWQKQGLDSQEVPMCRCEVCVTVLYR